MTTEIDNRQPQEDDACSEASSAANNGSAISTVPDKYGFLGGSQYLRDDERTISPTKVLRREQKWLRMIQNWDRYMSKNYPTIRERCRKGIPSSVRPRAWFYLCGARLVQNNCRETYANLCKKEGEARWVEDIKKDLHRQFPQHIMFSANDGLGQKELNFVLTAYSVLDTEVGFCQAQAPLAAFLLIHMPAEEAFWCLVSICDQYLNGYYSPGMENLQLDGDILFGLLKRVSPSSYRHLKKQKIEPVLYMTEWFLCAFTRSLPWPTVLRLWDVFLCEGIKVIFKAALVIIKYTLERRGVLKQCPTMAETLQVLKHPPAHVLEENFLISQIIRMDLDKDVFIKEHKKQLNKRQAQKMSAQSNPKGQK